MRAKQKIVQGRGPSNINLGIFVSDFDVCRAFLTSHLYYMDSNCFNRIDYVWKLVWMQGESAQVSESRQKDEKYFDCTRCNAYFKMLKILFILYHLNLTE